MTSLIDTLRHALGDAYQVEHELGGGGMARVFVATEAALERRVVIKVLPPELGETVSADRFHREIRVAAGLQHPHIVPVLSAGKAGPLLYYTMPFVEGETLRTRLAREGELPVSDTCRILAEVSRALSHAHHHGIVHRDIKPENILLSQGQAQVADFGIAKALTVAAGDESLTTAGLVLGTPAYMAPEQTTGGAAADPRSDIYALGVVGYEMLTGAPPFADRTPQALMAAHAVRHPEQLSDRRAAVPVRLAALVMRMLEKRPADRPQSADEVLRELDTAAVPTAPTTLTTEGRGKTRRGRWLVGFAALGLALLAGAAWLRSRRPEATLDPNVVAVVPFRVTGADSSLRYLREGMLDLLAAKLSGTNELRTVDPRTLLRAWQGAGGSAAKDLDANGARLLARRVGAGRLLEGEVIGTARRMVLNARLSDARSNSEVRAGVEGSSDSLTALVDRLAAHLLALGAGEEQHRLASLTTTSLPALRAYLDGRAEHRRGHFASARAHFDRAIELDSGFALAGIGRSMAALWLNESQDGPGSQLAWRHRDRLTNRDRVLLDFLIGPRHPYFSRLQDHLASAGSLVELAPDDPEAWSLLGDYTYHYAPLVGVTDALERSIRAYTRALALDSTYEPSLEHLYELYYLKGDTAAARRSLALRLRFDSTSPRAAGMRWFARAYLRDSVLGAISLDDDSLLTIPSQLVSAASQYGTPIAEVDSALEFARRRVSSEAELRELQGRSRVFYLIRGQPRRAQQTMWTPRTAFDSAVVILDALYADADTLAAAVLATDVPATFTRPGDAVAAGTIFKRYAAAQYRLSRGSPEAARQAVVAWRGSWTPEDTSEARLYAAHCAILLDAQLAALDRKPEALARLVELDSVLQRFGTILDPFGNIVAARLWNERGDPARALAAARRRVAGLRARAVNIAYIRDEARYAALAGDREGAIRGYRHYLRLRSDPEPAVRPKVDEVQTELAALERELTDR